MANIESELYYADLIFKHLQSTITDDEQIELDQWLAKDAQNSILFNNIADETLWAKEVAILETVSANSAWKRFEKTELKPAKIIKYRPWMYAAASVLVISVSLFLIYTKYEPSSKLDTTKQTKKSISPGTEKAMLRLADGTTIFLDSVLNGTLTKQGKIDIVKFGGMLTYSGNSTDQERMDYNTITTPRGGTFQLVLSDSTHVWLNASSSIRFPVTFSNSERKVEVTGEVYFEVNKNAYKPFKVVLPNKGEIEVLGTHFNVNAYSDESSVNTTLIEGSVKVFAPGKSAVVLKPGQQAQIGNNLGVKDNIDIEKVIAWKTGWFVFERADIKTIMREISRWYDVEIIFDGEPSNNTFSGVVSRKNDISKVLQIMEKAGVQFNIQGQKITVLPPKNAN